MMSSLYCHFVFIKTENVDCCDEYKRWVRSKELTQVCYRMLHRSRRPMRSRCSTISPAPNTNKRLLSCHIHLKENQLHAYN